MQCKKPELLRQAFDSRVEARETQDSPAHLVVPEDEELKMGPVEVVLLLKSQLKELLMDKA